MPSAPQPCYTERVTRRGWRTLAGSHMVSIEEELKAAEAAKAALSTLSAAPLSEATIKTLRDTRGTAIRAMSVFPSEALLNDARYNAGMAVSDLATNPPTAEMINKAKVAVEEWIKCLTSKKSE
jgi:hypothetical protein